MKKKSSDPSKGDTAAVEEHGELSEESVDPSAVPTDSADSISLPPAESELSSDEDSSGDDLYLRRSEQRGSSPEPSAMLTDDRLIESTGRYREVPEGF